MPWPTRRPASRAGARKFEPYDVGDGTTLSNILQTSNNPILPFIRERIVPILGQMKSGSRDAQTEAKWEAALCQLRDAHLVQERGLKGEIFKLTEEGYRVAGFLRPEPVAV